MNRHEDYRIDKARKNIGLNPLINEVFLAFGQKLFFRYEGSLMKSIQELIDKYDPIYMKDFMEIRLLIEQDIETLENLTIPKGLADPRIHPIAKDLAELNHNILIGVKENKLEQLKNLRDQIASLDESNDPIKLSNEKTIRLLKIIGVIDLLREKMANCNVSSDLQLSRVLIGLGTVSYTHLTLPTKA